MNMKRISFQIIRFFIGITCWIVSAAIYTFNQDGSYFGGVGLICVILAILGSAV